MKSYILRSLHVFTTAHTPPPPALLYWSCGGPPCCWCGSSSYPPTTHKHPQQNINRKEFFESIILIYGTWQCRYSYFLSFLLFPLSFLCVLAMCTSICVSFWESFFNFSPTTVNFCSSSLIKIWPTPTPHEKGQAKQQPNQLTSLLSVPLCITHTSTDTSCLSMVLAMCVREYEWWLVTPPAHAYTYTQGTDASPLSSPPRSLS